MEGATLDFESEDDYRYVIIGAGAIGGTVGAVLTRAGTPTVLVARGRHAEVLTTAGMTLRTPDGTFHTAVTAASRPEDVRLTRHDVLVFATKTQQLDAALQEWVDQPVHDRDGAAGTAGELLPVMTALNGVAAEEKALRYFGRVFGILRVVARRTPGTRRGDHTVLAGGRPVPHRTVARLDQHAGRR